jgi:hypothetical protein
LDIEKKTHANPHHAQTTHRTLLANFMEASIPG